jgi:hypothetical protein
MDSRLRGNDEDVVQPHAIKFSADGEGYHGFALAALNYGLHRLNGID